MEGLRLSGLGAFREAAVSDVIREDDGRQVTVQPGSRVFVNLVCSFFLSFLTRLYYYIFIN